MFIKGIKKALSSVLAAAMVLLSFTGTVTVNANLVLGEDDMNFVLSGDESYYIADSFRNISDTNTEIDSVTFPPYHSNLPVKVSKDLTAQQAGIKVIKYPNVLNNSNYPAFDVYEISPYVAPRRTVVNNNLLTVSCRYTGKVKLNLDCAFVIENIYLHCSELELGTFNTFKRNNTYCTYHVINETVKDVLIAGGVAESHILINDFTGEPIDKTALEKAIIHAEEIDKTAYTTSSAAVLDKAIKDAEKIIEKKDATQEQIDAALLALKTASTVDETGLAESGLKKKASKDKITEFEAAKNGAVRNSDGYTKDSYSVYKEALDKFDSLYECGYDDITDEQIDQAISELKAAENLLEKEKVILKTEEYESAKKAVEDILNVEVSPYTKKSLDNLRSLLVRQKSLVEDESGNIKDSILQSDVDAAAVALKMAVDSSSEGYCLVLKGNITDLAELTERVKQLVESYYTSDSWKALSDKLALANDLIANADNASTSDVKAAEQALSDAIKALKYKPADYTAVDAAIKKVPDDLSKYTDESVKALNDTLNAVDRTKNITEQEIVDEYAKSITDAVSALKEKPAPTDPSIDPGPTPPVSDIQTKPTPTAPAPTDSNTTNSTSNIVDKITSAKSAKQIQKGGSKSVKAAKIAKVTKLKVKSKAIRKITVSWKKVKKAKGYEVQLSKKKNFKKIILKDLTSKKNLVISSKKIKSGKTYYVRVRAFSIYIDSKSETKVAYSNWNKKLKKVIVK